MEPLERDDGGDDRAEQLDVLDLHIGHARELVSFERSRADSADSQAVATGSVAVAAAAIASAADVDVNVVIVLAAAGLVVASLSAVVARARYPPPALTGPRGSEAHQTTVVATAEGELQTVFSGKPDVLVVRERLVRVWTEMAERERVRAHRKNEWLTLSLGALLFGVLLGVLGVAIA